MSLATASREAFQVQSMTMLAAPSAERLLKELQGPLRVQSSRGP